MKLNKKQKQFLFKNYYVGASTFDAAEEEGWKEFFMDFFEWKLEDVGERWSGQKYGQLQLIHKEDKRMAYDITLMFQDNDYERLMSL